MCLFVWGFVSLLFDVIYVIQLTPHWGFSMPDYIESYACFQPKLAIFTIIEILLPYLCLS